MTLQLLKHPKATTKALRKGRGEGLFERAKKRKRKCAQKLPATPALLLFDDRIVLGPKICDNKRGAWVENEQKKADHRDYKE